MRLSALIRHGHIVTMDPTRRIIDDGFVAVGEDGRIAAIGPMPDCPATTAAQVIEARGMIVLPGLINTAGHAWQNLFKGADADAAALRRYAVTANAEDLAVAARHTAVEMIFSGTTTILNRAPRALSLTEATATIEPMLALGVRHVLSAPLRTHAHGRLRPHGEIATELRAATALIDHWHDRHDGLVRVALALDANVAAIAAGTIDEQWIMAANGLASEYGVRIANRLSDGCGATAHDYLAAQRALGRSDVLYLMELGVLDPTWLLAHGAYLSETDIDMMREAGCHAVYAPIDEALRGEATGPWARLVEAGVNCALSGGEPALTGSCDMVEQMKACTLVQNTTRFAAAAMPIETSLEMATINAARALGLNADIGSLEVGKRADIAVFNMRSPATQVAHKPLSNFVCCGRGTDAHAVLIDGRIVLHDGRLSDGGNGISWAHDARARGAAVISAAQWDQQSNAAAG